MPRLTTTHVVLAAVVLIVYSGLFWFIVGTFETQAINPVDSFILFDDDSREYHALARSILSGDGFVQERGGEIQSEVFRTPGYPLFVAITLSVVDSIYAVIFVQIILVVLTVLAIYEIGRRTLSPTIGLVAAALYAADPMTIIHSFTFFSDVLFTFLFVTAVLLFFVNSKRWIAITVIQGLLFGYAVLVRTIGLFAIPVVLMVYACTSAELLKQKLVRFGLILGVVLLCGVPWMARNHSIGGVFSLSTLGSYNALFYNVAQFVADRDGLSREEVLRHLHQEAGNPTVHDERSFGYSQRYGDLAKKYVLEDPIRYGLFHVRKTLSFFVASSFKNTKTLFIQIANEHGLSFSERIDNQTQVSLTLKDRLFHEFPFMLERVGWLVLVLMNVVAVLLSRGEKRRVMILFVVIVLIYAGLTGPVSIPRYRMPSEPFLLLTSLAGCVALWNFVSTKLSARSAM